MGEHLGEQLAPAAGRASSRRNKFTPLDRRSTMSLRRLSAWSGSAPAAIARSRPGSIASNACCAAGERSDRALPERQSATCRAAASGSAKPMPAELVAQDVGIVGQLRRARPARGRRRSRRPARRAGASRSSSVGAAREPVQPRDIVERRGLGRQQMRLRIVDHLHAVLDRAQQAVGVGELAAPSSRRAVRQRAAPRSRRASPATRTEASRPPWIICWIWTKNSTSRMPPRPRFRSIAGADIRRLARNGRGSAPKSAAPPRSPRNRASAARRTAGSRRGSAAPSAMSPARRARG